MMHINSLVSKLNLKDPWSAITHGIAMLLAIAGTAPLLLRAASGENAPLHIVALAVFILTMILLYTASTVYHSVDSTETVNRRLRKMDHIRAATAIRSARGISYYIIKAICMKSPRPCSTRSVRSALAFPVCSCADCRKGISPRQKTDLCVRRWTRLTTCSRSAN